MIVIREEIEEALKRVNHVIVATLREKKVKRNDRCPCGSGRKFKQCCMRELRT